MVLHDAFRRLEVIGSEDVVIVHDHEHWRGSVADALGDGVGLPKLVGAQVPASWMP